MKTLSTDLWKFHPDSWIGITTNGYINAQGQCVMGRGCALEAKKRYPNLPRIIANHIKEQGNHVFVFPKVKIITFPVKHKYNQMADLSLIRRSAKELVMQLDEYGIDEFYLPRPGCGNGKLRWADVEPILDEILDERVTVVHK